MSEETGASGREDVPATLARSDEAAQRTYAETRDSVEERYDDPQRAARTAWAAVKHGHEKVGDHWQPKPDGAKGPSDAQAEGGLGTDRPTAGGVDANASKEHLLGLARELDVPGRSSMTKDELVQAVREASDAATRRAREEDRQDG